MDKKNLIIKLFKSLRGEKEQILLNGSLLLFYFLVPWSPWCCFEFGHKPGI